jgi:hypothetical protein
MCGRRITGRLRESLSLFIFKSEDTTGYLVVVVWHPKDYDGSRAGSEFRHGFQLGNKRPSTTRGHDRGLQEKEDYGGTYP